MKQNVKFAGNARTPETSWKKISRLFTVVAVFSLVASFLAYTQLSLGKKQLNSLGTSILGHIARKMLKNTSQLEVSDGIRVAPGLTVIGNGSFYLYTVHAHQSIPGSRWDKLYMTGWEIKAALEQKYICCLKYENGTNGKAFSNYKLSFGGIKFLNSRQVICISNSSAIDAKPKWASLVLGSESCQDREQFHEVVYRLPEQAPAFAVCGKIAYDRKDPRYLIEWIEYYKYMGASKLVIYTYADLHEPARKVLNYYVDEGILETVPMPVVPLLDKHRRHFSVQNSSVMWQDEKVPLFDTEQRLRPYKYYAVIDTDEFITPKKPGVETLVDLMEHLVSKYKKGGTFKMKSEIHIMDWNKTNTNSDLMMEQYGNRTQSMIETPKFIHVTDRIREGTVWIHSTAAKKGYTVITPSAEDDVVLKHFRKCKQRWLVKNKDGVPNKCHGGFERHPDTILKDVARVIGPRIRHVKSLLGL